MEEQWKEIEGFPGYEISNLGMVRSYIINGGIRKTPYILKPRLNPNGYLFVNLHIGHHISKSKYIHKLVAMAFIQNPHNFPCVNHKDENKCNNMADNLEWCSYKYNANYGTAKYRIGEKNRKNKVKEIYQFDLKGNFIRSFFSLAEAGRVTGCKPENISAAALHKVRYAGCWLWSYDRNYNFSKEIDSIGEHVYLKYYQIFNQYNMKDELLHSYIGFNEVQKTFSRTIVRTFITNICKKGKGTVYGYKWKFGGPTFREYINN